MKKNWMVKSIALILALGLFVNSLVSVPYTALADEQQPGEIVAENIAAEENTAEIQQEPDAQEAPEETGTQSEVPAEESSVSESPEADTEGADATTDTGSDSGDNTTDSPADPVPAAETEDPGTAPETDDSSDDSPAASDESTQKEDGKTDNPSGKDPSQEKTDTEDKTGTDKETGSKTTADTDKESGSKTAADTDKKSGDKTAADTDKKSGDKTAADSDGKTDGKDKAGTDKDKKEAQTAGKLEKTLTASDGYQYKITVSFDAAAKIPDGAALEAAEVSEQESEEYLKKTADSLNWDDDDVVFYSRFFDISIVSEGREIQPAAPVEVTIRLTDVAETSAKAEKAAQALQVVHFEGSGSAATAQEVENTAEAVRTACDITFETEGFSVFGIGGIASRLLGWITGAVKVSVLGIAGLFSPSYTPVTVTGLEEGLELVEAFKVSGPKPLWIQIAYKAKEVLDSRESVTVYATEGGRLNDVLKENVENGDEMTVSLSSVDGFAIVKDTGFRHLSLESGDVALDGMMPKDAEVQVENALENEAVRTLPEDEEDTVLAAYDISIREGENDYQPKADSPVKVEMTVEGVSETSTLSVWHIKDDGSKEEVKDFTVEDGKVVFEADSFSIYAVIDRPPLCTYSFYTLNEYGDYIEYALNTDQGAVTFTQKVKDGEAVVAPQSPVNPSEPDTTFMGWYAGTMTEVGGSFVLQLEEEPFDFDHLPAVTEDSAVSLYAKFASFAYVVFHSQYDNETGTYPVLATRRGELTGAGTGSTQIDISDVTAGYDDGTGAPLQNMIFAGWSYTPVPTPGEGAESIIDDDSITITESTDLYPIYRAARWLSFHSGAHATYYGPEYHYAGTGRTELPVPERQGYTFAGWYSGAVVDDNDVILNLNGSYTDPASGTVYPAAVRISDENGALINGAADNESGVSVRNGMLLLSRNVTLYANWTAADADYSIVIWTEQEFETGTYDFRERFTLQAPAGTPVSPEEAYMQLTVDEVYNSLHDGESVSGEENPYYGFEYSSAESDTGTKPVEYDGTTVLNIYYRLTSGTTHEGPFSLTFKDSETGSVSPDLGEAGIVQAGIEGGTLLSSYVPSDPASGREGYSFNGWYADPTCTVRVFFENNSDYTSHAGNKLLYVTMPNTDLTVYAGWVKIRYLVQIDPNYGALYWDDGNQGTGATWFLTDYGERVSEYPHVTREYEASPSGTFYYVNHNYDYYQENGGDRKTYYTEDISRATEYTTFKASPNAYQYDGWYEVDPATGRETLYDFSRPITHDIYLKLHWRKTGVFYVEYNPVVTEDGTTLTGTLNAEDDTSLENLQYSDRAEVTVMRSAIAPQGYNFVGWKIRGDESNTLYYPSRTFRLPGEYAVTINGRETVVLDAVYVRVATASIVYNANGGSLSEPDYGAPVSEEGAPIPDPVTWCDDETATIANLVNNSGIVLSSGEGFARSGAELGGWNTKADGSGEHFDLGGTYYVDTSGDPVLYAEWIVKVYFDKNSDDAEWGVGWAENFTLDEDLGLYYTEVCINSLLSEPTAAVNHSSLNLEHWSREQNGTAYRFTTERVDGGMTLYACWTGDLLVPFHAVEISAGEKTDRSAWQIESSFKLGDGESIEDFEHLNKYLDVPEGYLVTACVSDSMENVPADDGNPVTKLENAGGAAVVTYQDGTTAVLPAGQAVYLVYTPIIPSPVTVQIRYVKEGPDGELTAVQGSSDGGSSVSDAITYGYETVTLNSEQVAQGQTVTVGLEDFCFSQERTTYFNIPPILDDGILEYDLVYNRIGVGPADASDFGALAGKSSSLLLHLQIRNRQLMWSFDGESWTAFTDEEPAVYAIYRERGYELEIAKTIPVATWGSADREFTVTLSSPAITRETYDVLGTGYDTISATPRDGETDGTIVLTVKDGSRIRLLGLPRGVYTITESGNENYTLTAKTGPFGNELTDASVSDSSFDITLTEDTQAVLTNTPEVICRIGDVFFYTLNEALEYAGEERAGTATIRMLVDYMMPATDALVIPAGYDITLATSSTSYTGEGTCACITRAAGFTDAPMFTNFGTFTLDTVTLDGGAVSTADPMVQNEGTLTVNPDAVLQNANSTGNGGAIRSADGVVELKGSVSGNTAAKGGAVYASGGDVILNGGTLSGNTAADGGALYYSGSGVLSITDGSVSGNSASGGSGGAVYVAGGTVNVTGGTIENNTAESGSGGAVYASSALITIENEAAVRGNTAQSGGAVYTENGTISISGGSLTGNTATGANGGAVYIGTGSISISGGTLSGNTAENGNGGAVYTDSATLDLSGGSLTGNSAVGGSAVYTNSGTADFSGGSITGNTAVSGGAVGIGSADVKLNFTGAPVITNNTMDGAASNVYLDQDSDTVINTTGLSTGANIGIYVPGEFTGDLFVHRGEAAASFASYPTSAVSNMACFHNDRLPGLTVVANSDARKLLWGKALAFEVRYLASYQNGFPPAQAGQNKYSNNSYYPSSSTNVVSELAGDMYSLFASRLTSTAAFGGAFVEGDTAYDGFLTDVNWDSETQKWQFVRRTGETVTDKKLILFYAEPAYITIENNTGYPLDLSELSVAGRSAANTDTNAGYGFVVARDGATSESLLPIVQSDLQLAAGHSIKLLFPGAVNQNYSFDGTFPGAAGDISYTRTGTAAGTIPMADANAGFTLTGKTMNTNGGVLEIKFGGEKPICKIVTDEIAQVGDDEIVGRSEPADGKVEYTFSTLNQAIRFIQNHNLRTAAVEMLIDYLIPESDVVTLPQGYDITFTTAVNGVFQYSGTDPARRATISRDTGNLKSIISSNVGANSSTKLTVENLNFDGKSLVGDINGGVIKTLNCDVTLKNADFLNCIANNGGGVYIEFSGTAGNNSGILTADTVAFRNCRAKSSASRQGGGAIWTDAATLNLKDCSFTNCTAYDQGGAVFHRVDGNYNTSTTATGCTFENCEARAAGAFETDAKYVSIIDCNLKNCIATQRNGGGINIYSVNSATPAVSTGATVTVTGCTFENCHAYNTASNGYGGGFRSTAVETTVKDCTFINTTSRLGGGISVSNINATKLTVTGTTITNSSATEKGGGIYATALNVQIGAENEGVDTVVQDCTSGQNGGGICLERNGTTSSVTLLNTKIENCVSTGGAGGGLITNGRTVSLTGTSVLNNRASGNGGGVNTTDTGVMLTLDGCTIQDNEAGNMGGGVYCASQMTMRNGTLISGNQLSTDTAINAAGVYLANKLTVGTEGADEPDSSSIKDNLTVNRTPSNLRMRVNGSVNHTQSVSVLCDLNGSIGVVNASARGTQFGTSSNSYPAGFTDLAHVFTADDESLYGIIDRSDANGKKIIWCTLPICKITDERGRLLYFDPSGTSPMIFDKLDVGNSNTKNRTAAFSFLRNTTAKFYYKNGTEYTGNSFMVKMLVETYEQEKQIDAVNSARKITLTTAGAADSDGYPYRGRAGSRATIIRSTKLTNTRMMTVQTDLTLQNITIDGGSLQGIAATDNTHIIVANSNRANITLGVNATLQNSETTRYGGAVEMSGGSRLTIAGGMIRNCSANSGGAVYVGGNSQAAMSAGSITLCTADGSEGNGGGVCVQQGSFSMSGGSITRSSAKRGGGVCVYNQQVLNMSGGSITGNTADERGGGIAVTGTDNAASTRLNFSGLVNVSGNTMNGETDNLELDYDTNAIIQSRGLYRGSVIGVYVPDGNTLYEKHGDEGDPFGTYTGDTTYLYCFVNDRNGLKGGLISGGDPNTIYWVVVYSLEISKQVLSDNVYDMTSEYEFTLTLSGQSDKDPSVTGESINGERSIDPARSLYFENGVARFRLKNGESITADDLPTGITYEVTENLTAEQQAYFTVLPGQTITGRIGENLQREDVTFKYVSKAAFTNLHAVCKITAPVNGTSLLYYKNADDEYTPAVYSRLITAFNTVNNDTPLYYWDVYSDLWKPYTGTEHQIEMLIPDYTMAEAITLNSGKDVTLTTASPNARDGYPYAGSREAVIGRGFSTASMFTANGSLTLTNIDLNGNSASHSVSSSGGIVKVNANGALTVTDGAVLENSATSGNGGAVYVANNGSMTVAGSPVIQNNTAANGAGIYLDGTGSVLNLQDSPVFTGNIISSNPLSGKKNGGEEVYNDGVRQDIYLKSGSTGTVPNIRVTGDLTGADGSIWVWAEPAEHYRIGDQFAILSGSTDYSVTAFRNARDDATTGNEPASTYLTGQLRNSDGKVYWSSAVLTITKTITGAMADMADTFTFTISGLSGGKIYRYTNYTSTDGTDWTAGTSGTQTAANDGTIQFVLGHHERVDLILPFGTTVTIHEESGYYKASYVIGSEPSAEGDTIEDLTMSKDQTVAVTNDYTAVAPTGFGTNNTPFGTTLLLGVMIAAIALMPVALRRRKQRGGGER